ILTSYNLISGEWAQPVLVGDCQSRSDFIYYNNGLYLFYAPTDREHIGILRINTDNLAQSEVVLQADMKGSCFYPFVQYNSDGELCMSYTVSRQHIRLASFNLGELVKEEIISGSISAEYSRIATERGFAEGIITITPSADSDAESYEIYWGNDSGILSDFTLLASVTANGTNSISFEINKEIMIPLDANKIYVYPKKGDTLGTAEVIEIDSSALGAYSKKKYSFQVISDLHSGNSDEFYQQAKIRAALEDIKKTEPDSSGIIINGDSVESNTDAYWEQLVKTLNASIAKDIPLYFTAGNCELEADADETYTQQINRYLKYTNQFSDVQADSVYYAHKINGQYFIHLGSQSQTENGYADLHQDQLDWLKGALKHADKEGVRAYVFIHQPLKNTVSGTFEAFNQNRYGVVQDSELRDILDKYSNVLVFSGHTHINLECVQPALLGGTEKPSYFNNASIGNMVKMSNADTMDYEGSQGLFVDVYNDKIIVRGRDFANKKWISAAQFVVYTGDAPEELSQLNAEFFDERGNKLIGFDSIASTDNAKVHISLPDEIKKNSEGVALVAFYDANGRYIKLCTEEITDFSKDIEFGMGKAVKETGGSVKVFMWDSLDSMKPLCKSAGV
ncbi:MAG: metallophosphoesterase family protein, partial [Clostridia bacterium]